MDVTFKNYSNKKLFYIFFGISFLLHFMISYTHIEQMIHLSSFSEDKDEKRIMIKLQNNLDTKTKQIVQTEQSKVDVKVKSTLLSNRNNRFERETKSAHTGSFQSAAKGNRNAVANKQQQSEKIAKKEKFKKLKFSDLAYKSQNEAIIKQVKKIKKTALMRKGLKNGKIKGQGLGQNNDFLEEMPLGDFTKLNTQEYEFYGFYHRVRQKLEQFWGANIQQQAERIFKQGRSLASESNLITGLTISLNTKGEIVDILVKSTSGIKELDDAAIESFNQAGPFPNPPKGMVKSGRAIIEWGFVVNT